MLFVGRPVAKSMRWIDGRFDPSHVFTPQRSIAQISLRGPISTLDPTGAFGDNYLLWGATAIAAAFVALRLLRIA